MIAHSNFMAAYSDLEIAKSVVLAIAIFDRLEMLENDRVRFPKHFIFIVEIGFI